MKSYNARYGALHQVQQVIGNALSKVFGRFSDKDTSFRDACDQLAASEVTAVKPPRPTGMKKMM